jgi:hypothetical protein
MDFQQELDRIANAYANQGFRIIQRPKLEDLPSFAQDFQVEIVGMRGDEGVLVSVKQTRDDVIADRNLQRYAEVAASQHGWRFDLVILEGEGPMGRRPPEARDFSPADIDKALAEAGELVRVGFLRPAAISAWAALEAAMRLRLRASGERAGWGTTPRVLANELYSSGILSAREFREIEKFFRIRNEIVHGFALQTPEVVSVQLLTDIARRLTEESRPQVQSA